ncbi:hypothetical protein SC438_06075 [Legionella pneumophila]|uniref:hypothetical protein n=1 Tax=Legionella pneumophila TaxID=446 RepID=UPI001374F738|nr:hypothetical protein [Legionella pneumophila]HAT8815008.1 hypothetical protein [Legionella pneumophila subsp. pneumophila]MCZ4806496.1 hypothetical protein [Legionella pneumophila]MDW9179175.1 hypothetical protein [Legionella pneumophila]HAT1823449.1 hypothetical protein [Legionella pneumophila]HAT1863630.1 hypothetical protein [Legionella pneumophila]
MSRDILKMLVNATRGISKEVRDISTKDFSIDDAKHAVKTLLGLSTSSLNVFDSNPEQLDFEEDKLRAKIDEVSRDPEILADHITRVNNYLKERGIGIDEHSAALIIAQMQNKIPPGSNEDLAYEKLISKAFYENGMKTLLEGIKLNKNDPGSGANLVREGITDLIGAALHGAFGPFKDFANQVTQSLNQRKWDGVKPDEDPKTEQLINKIVEDNNLPQHFAYSRVLDDAQISPFSRGNTRTGDTEPQSQTLPKDTLKEMDRNSKGAINANQAKNTTRQAMPDQGVDNNEQNTKAREREISASRSEQGIETSKVEQERSILNTICFRSECKQIRLNGRDQQPKRDEIAAHNPGEDNESDIFTSIKFPR